MKRFLLTVALIVAVLGVMLYFMPRSACDDVSSYAELNAVVSVYCRGASCDSVDLGFGRMVVCPVKQLKATLAACDRVDGLSVRFAGDMSSLQAIVKRLNATQVSCQELNGLYVACFYSNRLQGGVTVDGARVNVQIAYNDGVITVGYPLILGDY